MARRVVVTGLGVVAPNGVGIPEFEVSLRERRSGIRYVPGLEELGFSCHIAGEPQIPEERLQECFSPLELRQLQSTGIWYGVLAGVEACKDAGIPIGGAVGPDWDSGIIFGTGILGVEKFRDAILKIDEGKVRRLGSTSVVQTMASGISAYLNARLGFGNLVTTNSSACTTGTEAVLLAYDRIRSGKAVRMLAGSCGESGPYVWGGFDAMRILPYQFNSNPEAGSRPLSATASGFVPGSGAGALLLEELESARERGAEIYAEVAGGQINSGGQRNGGSLTAPNHAGVRRGIRDALRDAQIAPEQIDAINGHLTATSVDTQEVRNWVEAISRKGTTFPYLNSLKGMTGHCLSAAGSIECVASVLQVKKDFIFGNLNSEDLHPEICELIARDKVPITSLERKVNVVVKASFGFGDVNAVVVLKKYQLEKS